MKKLFFSLVALMMATMSFAQGSLLSTLSHDGTIRAFYGAETLKSAVTAVEHCDVITLSSGQFKAATINKAITLLGIIMEEDTTTGAFGTKIISNYEIN